MSNIINLICNHWSSICSTVLSIITACSLIVKLTPSLKDDSILSKFISICDKLSIAKTAKDKELINKAKEFLE